MDDLPSFLKLAKNVSKHSTFRVRIGAVISVKNRPISVGFNKTKYNSEFSHLREQSLHAEMMALKTSGRNYLYKATIYVYRERKDGTIAIARPCNDCIGMLKRFGVKTMVYTIEDYPYFRIERL